MKRARKHKHGAPENLGPERDLRPEKTDLRPETPMS